jgi:(2Fe-2S) ferredoxin
MAMAAKKIVPPQTVAVDRITVCHYPQAKNCEAEAVFRGLTAEIEKGKLPVTVEPAKCGCSGACQDGAYLSFPGWGVFYHKVKEGHVPTIIKETVLKGKTIFPLLRLNPLQSIRRDLIWDKTHRCFMVLDPNTCIPRVAEYLIKFHYDESCGKCTPCRLGIRRLAEVMEGVVQGRAQGDALKEMESLIRLMLDAPYCQFAGKVAQLILALFTYFKKEFEAHILEKTCPSGVCPLGK